MGKKPPAALAAAIAAGPPAGASEDRLEALRGMVRRARDLEERKAELAEELRLVGEELERLYFTDVPDLMDEVGVDRVGLQAEGNHGATDATAQPFYSANIAASWPEERRRAAFSWLEGNGHGDLIKTEVVVKFPREARARAIKFAAQAEKSGLSPVVRESVHSQTLTAWLKEQVEQHGEMPPLDVVGGFVGRVVRLKERK